MHDTRIFELYYLLKILAIYKIKSKTIHRKLLENDFSQRLNTPNSNGWRNIFITLSTLGLINKKTNEPNQAGINLANKTYPEFACIIFKYLEPFFKIIINTLKEHNLSLKNKINISNLELFELIYKQYKEISYLVEIQNTDSTKNTRYISSYLNILRDDYGVINFKPKSKERELLFDPLISNEKAFIEHIKKYSQQKYYEENFKRIINEI
ncbi:hypothetical protein DMB92_05415 [Campylobacter sp. MIT 99-7217]|nr:hypothetical protein DMB92_05415 [Campylobacter sp. MIT 99-7217]